MGSLYIAGKGLDSHATGLTLVTALLVPPSLNPTLKYLLLYVSPHVEQRLPKSPLTPSHQQYEQLFVPRLRTRARWH
jgi:hypothetical protein